MLDDENKQSKKHYKRSGLAYGVLGAIIAVFLITTVFQWKGISIDINTSKPTAQADEVQLGKTQEAVTQAVNETAQTVVGISNIKEGPRGLQKAGTGSGVIYKKDGNQAYIVTNHHVVANASQLEVILSDGTKVEAQLKGSDPLTDLAVLQIDSEHVKEVAELGSAKDVEVGQTAIAIGNPLGMEFAGSVTKGIVSGLNRNIPVDINGDRQPDWQTEVIQTDAAINPGNSGGALVNLQGEVIGINSMKIAKEKVEGIGFAIPMDVAKPVIKDLENQGSVERPYMGISLQDVSQVPGSILERKLNLPSDVKQGVIVAGVAQGTPAADANLQKYDVITKIDDKQVKSLMSLRQYLYTEAEAGEQVELTVYRNGEPMKVSLELSSQ
ncbi:trypsin-like peptidase domain-containing protein [Halobacillus shinanisalinarum]|uniref:Trypsin-like peptidase domain-containing protein n=1 Tax=Halobacillus shinanisalinarum TaxID=2932258 RepID=A0ABY4H4Q0_9BACI|nr:trypsin-like peptidase domain-containing protein [Halobacillus shinanisalinarum]UOQ95196.1 trypsin-like peptidase domain-containing protein [Halobacillus shinanisalinarum]